MFDYNIQNNFKDENIILYNIQNRNENNVSQSLVLALYFIQLKLHYNNYLALIDEAMNYSQSSLKSYETEPTRHGVTSFIVARYHFDNQLTISESSRFF